MKPRAASVDLIELIPCETGGTDRNRVEEAMHAWLRSPAFASLLLAFDGPTVSSDLRRSLALIGAWSEIWDFRQGLERNLSRLTNLTEAQEQVTLEAAHSLGLRGRFDKPPRRQYDHALILGGMVRACLLRPFWAAELTRLGFSFRTITAVGGFRQLGGDEPKLAKLAGISKVTDEMDCLEAGLRLAFSIGQELNPESHTGSDPHENWTVRRFHSDPPCLLIAAPSSEPSKRRANTADTYEWWANNVVSLTEEDRVLLVTSQIYVPFQHADAVRILGLKYSCGIDTVGVPPDLTAGLPPQEFSPRHYLQELRSTIRAFHSLLDAIDRGRTIDANS